MGLFGSIAKGLGKVVKKVAGTALTVSPAGRAIKIARGVGVAVGRKLGRKGRKIAVKVAKGAGSIAAYEAVSRGVDFAVSKRSKPGAMITGLEGTGRKGGGFKSYRRMNPGNAKALRRAIRRVDRFKKLARAVGFSRPPAKVRGVHTVKGM